jgi:hypothetical protein
MASKKEIVINLTSPFNNNTSITSPKIRKSQTFHRLRELNVKLYLFWIQGVFSIIVIAFCFTMLVRGGEVCEYIAVITGVLGYWLPSPNYNDGFSIQNKDDNSSQGKKVSYVSNNNIIIETQSTPNTNNKRRLSLDSALETYKTAESIPFEIETSSKPPIRRSIEKIIRKK